MRTTRTILQELSGFWPRLLLSIVFNFLSAAFAVLSISMVIPLLSLLFSGVDAHLAPAEFSFSFDALKDNFLYLLGIIINRHGELRALTYIVLIVFLAAIFRNLFAYLGRYIVFKVRLVLAYNLRNKLFTKVMNLDLQHFVGHRKGDIISRIAMDVREFEASILNSVTSVLRDPVLIIVYLLVLFKMSISLTLFVILLLPLGLYFITRMGNRLKKVTLKRQEGVANIINVLEEILGNIKIVKAFTAEKEAYEDFSRSNSQLTSKFSISWKRRSLLTPFIDLSTTLLIVIIMWFGSSLVIKGESGLSSEEFIAYLIIFSQLMAPTRAISNSYAGFVNGKASYERIMELLETEEQIVDEPGAKRIKDFNRQIVFENVCFRFEEKWILNHINLRIEKGQTLALIGPSGSGKTTLVDMLPRFHDATKGEIKIDDIPVRMCKIDDLRSLFGYVSQAPVLFHDTIYNNIRYNLKNVSEEDVKKAAKQAFAHGFIQEKEQGYQTVIGESGTKLSQGEKQRIAIARAILKNAPILILDEATSSLDTGAEREVRAALENLMKGKTTIVIAHRLYTIEHADEICVLDEGRIVEQGKHQALMEKEGLYKRLKDLEIFA